MIGGVGGMVSHYEILEILERGERWSVLKARDIGHMGPIGDTGDTGGIGGAGDAGARDATPSLTRSGGGGTRPEAHLVVLEISVSPVPDAVAARVRRDVEAAARLDHPHILPIYEFGTTPDGGVFVARALESESLRGRIARNPLSPEHAVGLASQIAAALSRAHAKGIIHRDLRPSNILLTSDGQAKIAGFGAAWLLDGAMASIPSGAVSSGLPAAIAYRAPEQLRAVPAGSADPRSDIWSLGVLLYQMVTGRHPFPSSGESDLAAAILEREPEPMTAVNPGLPVELESLVARALAKDPARRPARMDEFLVSLRGILASGLSEVDSTVVQVPGLRTARPDSASVSKASRSGSLWMGIPGQDAEEGHAEGVAIAHYRILGLLGGGSMGRVYRAEDTRLRRNVALKFLPGELARDPVAKARFFQEAQAASALDHTNICTIHEVGETGDGHLYIAMASYDGETVRSRIARGALPVAEAVEIARQTAAGLAKAHRGGIVHRDIKPANLVVTTDGVVKIVDFGVAKLRGAASVNVAGSFLGTPAYMSPEQARGEEVDSRADIWSLGVVLYEMLAGVRPFKHDDDLTSVLRSLLEDRPEGLGRIRPDVKPELERIVARMLARSPSERYQTAAEVADELAALQAPPRPLLRRPWVWAAVALAAVALGVGSYLTLRHRSAAAASQLGQPVFTRLTDQEGREHYPSLAPDGLSYVYVKTIDGRMDIYHRKRDNDADPLNLTAGVPEDDSQPAISPDGKSLAFRSERGGGGIFIMSLKGGTARRISDMGYNPAWSPDGRELAVATEGIVDPGMRKSQSEIWILDVESGLKRRIVGSAGDMGNDGVQPSWSPDGSRIAYWGVPAEGARRILWTVASEGGKPSKLLDDGASNWNPVWAPDGVWLYFGSDRSGSMNLWRMRVDQRSGDRKGEAEPVTIPAMASGFWSFSSDGRQMIYASNESKSNIESYPLDPATLRAGDTRTAVTRGSHMVLSGAVSPDGTRIAYHAALPHEDLFVVHADGTGLRQLTDDDSKDRQPFWSPDGRRLAFYSNRGGPYEAWLLSWPGGVIERVLPEGIGAVMFPVWSPDGKRLACTQEGGPAIIDLTRPVAVRRPEPLPPPSALGEGFYPISWSSDGEWIAGNIARLDGSMSEGIGVYSMATRTYERWTSRGTNPVWLQDSKRLLYTEDGDIFAFDTRTHEAQRVLSPPSSSTYLSVSTGPGDRTLYTVRGVNEGDIWLLSAGVEE